MKQTLREQHRAARRGLEQALIDEGSLAITRAVLGLPELLQAGTIALYQALRGEVQTARLVQELEAVDKRCLFPRMVAGSRALAFAPVDDPDEMAAGSMGILEPREGADRDLAEIDLFIVPGLAFDPRGGRLGQGAGYYDATLAAAPWALRVAVCFDHQLVDELPMEPHDQHMDLVITPSRVIRTTDRIRDRSAGVG